MGAHRDLSNAVAKEICGGNGKGEGTGRRLRASDVKRSRRKILDSAGAVQETVKEERLVTQQTANLASVTY